MILGTGIDVVAINRIARLYSRHGERCLRRLLTPAEQDLLAARGMPVAGLAGRFAAKEAVMKALGTGWAGGIQFTQIEILNNDRGTPYVQLYGAAARRMAELGGRRWHISISHCREVAVAHAVLED